MFGPFTFIAWIIFLVLGIIVALDAKKAGRQGWWIYLICAFFLVPAIIVVILWYVHAKKNPIRFSSSFSM